MFTIVLYLLTKINVSYIYSMKFTKYLHGTRTLLNILIISLKEKSIILTHTKYCWIATDIPLWLVSWSIVTYYKNIL